MSNIYHIIERLPTVEEYRQLCTSVGWEAVMNFEAAPEALARSLYAVVAMTEEDQIIGMGRIVGDGAIFFYIQDIAVIPEYQKSGVGTKIMDALMQYVQRHAPQKAFIGLYSAQGKQGFYEKYGFRDYSPNMTGMILFQQD